MIPRTSTIVLLLFLLSGAFFGPTPSSGQSSTQSEQDPSTFTFQTDTRIVLTDVAVTDTNGNPVHDLPQSAFRIFDDKQPQVIASFEEHVRPPATTLKPASAPGIYSNDYLLQLPPVLNIVLLDVTNLEMADQMYLNYELTKVLREQPEGQPLAIYLRAGSGCFMVQNFTSDRKLLLDGLQKAIPRFPPHDREDIGDFAALRQIVFNLRQLPGRKNVLWFSGGSTGSLIPDAIPLQDERAWHELYDQLDQERIGIYPIDARGLLADNTINMAVARQHMAMDSVAQATGGSAFYNSNGLSEITQRLLASNNGFYTLTYSPRPLRLDNRWHKISIEVTGSAYHLSYRRGYFADGSVREKDHAQKPRTRLLSNGEKLEVGAQEEEGRRRRDRPIIFLASVKASPGTAMADLNKGSNPLPITGARHGWSAFTIRYTLPMDALTVRVVSDKHKIAVGVAAIGLDGDGSVVEHKAELITLNLPDDILHRKPDLPITVEQQIALPKESQSLHLGIWDAASGRFGTIDIPVDAHRLD